MNFWIGVVIAAVSGLFRIGYLRDIVKRKCPSINDRHIDFCGYALLLFGLLLAVQNHAQLDEKLSELQQKTEPRHLSAVQRRAMLPILAKLEGQQVAFVCGGPMDRESCDYAEDLAALFKEAGCVVPKIKEGLLKDLPGYLALAPHGNVDPHVVPVLAAAFTAANIPAKIETVEERFVGRMDNDVVHVIVGRKAP